ncbi:MAG: transcription elongation factor GreA [Dehalococcoidales bacterium]|nr:MAG: transcription elongation factor GreA [Dehalococcoidales bacterium]
MTSGSEISLGEAARRFLADLPAETRSSSQQEIYRFVRWYGWEQTFTGLVPAGVANYAEQLSQSDADYSQKLESIRAFLSYARKRGWSKVNLATHLKTRKTKSKSTVSRGSKRQPVSLTEQGYDELKAELTVLQGKRLQLIEDIRRAAADKDFRENAPLDAAREQRGHVEGRIIELEAILGSAIILEEAREVTHTASLGDEIVLQDLASGEEVRYTLVSPTEVDATSGKISGASPIGRAIVGKVQGNVVEVTVPAGKLRYKILRIGD